MGTPEIGMFPQPAAMRELGRGGMNDPTRVFETDDPWSRCAERGRAGAETRRDDEAGSLEQVRGPQDSNVR